MAAKIYIRIFVLVAVLAETVKCSHRPLDHDRFGRPYVVYYDDAKNNKPGIVSQKLKSEPLPTEALPPVYSPALALQEITTNIISEHTTDTGVGPVLTQVPPGLSEVAPPVSGDLPVEQQVLTLGQPVVAVTAPTIPQIGQPLIVWNGMDGYFAVPQKGVPQAVANFPVRAANFPKIPNSLGITSCGPLCVNSVYGCMCPQGQKVTVDRELSQIDHLNGISFLDKIKTEYVISRNVI